MRTKIELTPAISGNDVVVQFTSAVKLDKFVSATVPAEFSAFIYIDEKPSARLDACNRMNVLKYLGKSYLGKSIKLAFIRKNDLPYIPWGFGDINVKNKKLHETYRVGANGKYLLKIKDPSLLIKSFGTDKNIDIEMITGKTKEIIKTIGKPTLSQYFADSMVSVFEINSKIEEMRQTIETKIKAENVFLDAGLEIKTITIDGVHVNDDDMDSIREHINNRGGDGVAKVTDIERIKQDIIDSIKESSDGSTAAEIQNLKEEIARIAENQEIDAVVDEIDNLRAEVEKALKRSQSDKSASAISNLSKQLDELKAQIADQKRSDAAECIIQTKKMVDELDKKLAGRLDSSLAAIKSILENSAEEKAQSLLPLYDSAKEQWLKELKLTTDLQLEKAESDDDYASVAGLLYSNVESNLINNFKVSHRGRDFYMPEEEFDDYAGKIKIDGRPVFRDTFKRKYLNYPDLEGKYVEIPPEIRFMKAGLSVEDACQAAKDWTLINKLRHRSEENKRDLDRALAIRNLSRKEFLKYVVDFYRNTGLYTRD